MFRKNSHILDTSVAGLTFANPVGVPYTIRNQRFKFLHRVPSAGFFILTPPQDHVLSWIKDLKKDPVNDAILAVDINTDIIRTFSLVYDFADLIIVDPDTDNGIESTDLADTVSLLDELVSLRLCYEHYTPVFLRLAHGITPEELHTLLDTCQLGGLDGVFVPSLMMYSKVKELTLGRFPAVCMVQNPEEALLALKEGVSLVEAKPGFKGLNKLLKTLEKQ